MQFSRFDARHAGADGVGSRGDDVDGGGVPFYVIGHRGSPCKEVENTIPSLERAVADGANSLEFDLCITQDGIVVVWHDWDPDEDICMARCNGLEPDVKFCPRVPDDKRYRRHVNKLTFHEFIDNYGYGEKESDCSRVDACIPTFDETIRWAVERPQIRLVFLDVKIPNDQPQEVPRLMTQVKEVLDRYQPRFRIVYETMQPRVLEAMRRFDPSAACTLDRGPIPGIILRPSRFGAVRDAIRFGNPFATVERPNKMTFTPWGTYKRVVRHDLELLRRHNRSGAGTPIEGLICYTVNNEDELRTLVEMGVGGIQTDKPELLAAIVRSMGHERAAQKVRAAHGASSRAVATGNPAGVFRR